MKLFRFAFLVVLLPLMASAQTRYQPGYIIKLNGDTSRGFISYSQRNITPLTVNFKPTLEDKTSTRFEPARLKGFEVVGIDKFITYTGRVSMDKNKFPDVAATLDTTTVQASLFLRVSYEGKPLSVLEQQDQLKARIFIREAGRIPAELIYYQFSDKNSGNGVRSVELYKDTLQAIAQKYNRNNVKLTRNISLASFTTSNIESIVKQIDQDDSKSKQTLSLGFFAGIAYSNNRTKMEGATVFNGQSSSTSYPRLSIGIDLADRIYVKNFILRLEASYTAFKPRYHIKEVIGASPIVTDYTYQFDRSVFTFTPQVIYNFINRKQLSAFIGVGMNIVTGTFAKDKLTRNGSALDELYSFSNSWLLIPVQAGITLNKKLDIFADYTLPTTNSTNQAVALRYTNLGIGIHYHFGK